MLILRDYQNKMIDDARKALQSASRIMLQGPTGCGKTAITVFMMQRASSMGKRCMFIVHQNELLRQTSKALWKQKLEHGMVASGRVLSNVPTQVASVQTLVRRLDIIKEPDLIIIDEAHRSASNSYKAIIEAWPNSKVIGLTATPQRTDGKGLDDMYSYIVMGPTIRQLIDAGYLCDYEIFAPPCQANVDSIKTRMGDYDKKELAAEIDRPTITGDAVATYKRYASGKRCVVMCVSIAHAEHVMTSYNQEGVTADMIDGSMSDNERESKLDSFRSGQTLIMCNVNLLVEGVDIPSIEAVQWLRPTKSLIIWMQGNGRGLRPKDNGGSLIILDQVGNWHRHGLPDDDREWRLEGSKSRKRKKDDEEPDVHVQQCKHCFHIFRSGVSECPKCGNAVELKTRKELKVIEGELEKVDKAKERKQKRQQQGAAKGLYELVQLGVSRGMNKPAAWAANVFASRQGRKATAKDYNEAGAELTRLRGAG